MEQSNWVDVVVPLVPLGLWAAALLATALSVALGPRPITSGIIVDRLLKYALIFPLGLQSLWSFLLHVFVPEEAAALTGWEPSPFQYELGVAYLGVALAALYAAFQGFQARAAVAVMAACLLAGAAVGHLIDVGLGDAPVSANSGISLYNQILTPILLLVLVLAGSWMSKTKPKEIEASLANRIETALGALATTEQPAEEPAPVPVPVPVSKVEEPAPPPRREEAPTPRRMPVVEGAPNPRRTPVVEETPAPRRTRIVPDAPTLRRTPVVPPRSEPLPRHTDFVRPRQTSAPRSSIEEELERTRSAVREQMRDEPQPAGGTSAKPQEGPRRKIERPRRPGRRFET
jgi:hypothetical protein